MIKKTVVIFTLLLALSGCAGKQPAEVQANGNNNQNADKLAAVFDPFTNNEKFKEIDLSQIELQVNVFVMGKTSDNFIIADSIIVAPEDFKLQDLMPKPQSAGVDSTDNQPTDIQKNSDSSAPKPDNPANFQNLTPEQRAQFQQQRGANGRTWQQQGTADQAGQAKGRVGGTAASRANLQGKIIQKDAASITIEIKEGGSKIVFLSDNTKFYAAVDAGEPVEQP